MESVFSVMDRMGRIAGTASSPLISSTERTILTAEFDSLKQLSELEDLQFQGYNLFKASEASLSVTNGNPQNCI